MNKKAFRIFMLILCMMLPLGIGILSSLLTPDAREIFESLNKPPFSPPGIMFPIVWSFLYICIGLGSFFIYESNSQCKKKILILYAIQLLCNFFWNPIFFMLHMYYFSIIWIGVMWTIGFIIFISSRKISRAATLTFIPYILWCLYAGYLAAGFAVLN